MQLEIEEHPVTKALEAAAEKYAMLIVQILDVAKDQPTHIAIEITTRTGKRFEMRFVPKDEMS